MTSLTMTPSVEDVEKSGLRKDDAGEDGQPKPASLQKSSFIDWEAHDPEDSMNWTPGKKWMTVSLVACMSAITSLGSSIVAPATPQIMMEFQSTNRQLAILVVSIGIL